MRNNSFNHSQGMVERWNRTMREWIELYLTDKKTNRWIDVLKEIVEHYNHRKNRVTGFAPENVGIVEENQIKMKRLRQPKSIRARTQSDSLHVGDNVRTLQTKDRFEKGGLMWSRNVHKIEARNGERFQLEGGRKWWKYSDLQKVGADSKNIDDKAPEQKQAIADVQHTRRLMQSNLYDTPQQAMQEVQDRKSVV